MKDYTNGPQPGLLRIWWNAGAFVPILFMCAFLYLGIESARTVFANRAFDARSVETDAQVDSRYAAGEDFFPRIGETNPQPQDDLYVVLRYQAGGEEFRETVNVSLDLYERAPPGSTHRVRYLPEEPSDVEFKIGETRDNGQQMLLFVGLAGVGWLVTFGPTVAIAVAALRARRFGQVERARVGGVKTFTFRGLTMFSLEFFGEDGKSSGSFSSMSRLRYDAYPPGTEVEVFRGAKGRLWWVGDVGPRAAAPTVPSVRKP